MYFQVLLNSSSSMTNVTYIYLILSTISLESHYKFTFSRLISFVALGHSSVDRVVTDKIQYYNIRISESTNLEICLLALF